MSRLDGEEQLSEAERDLARQLLDSARLDDAAMLPASVAWARFSSTLSLLGQHAAPAIAHEPGSTTGKGESVVFANSTALRWLVVGAIAGSAITAAWLTPPGRSSTTHARPTSAALTGSASSDVNSAPAASAEPDVAASAASARQPPPATPARPRRPAVVPSDTLAAEVALLDAARTALEVGAFGEAQRLVAEYQRQFPRGELSLESRVIQIEALSAQGDKAEARRKGARFLEQHANDPHAERVHQLIDQAPR